jgi:hypothetical protein
MPEVATMKWEDAVRTLLNQTSGSGDDVTSVEGLVLSKNYEVIDNVQWAA